MKAPLVIATIAVIATLIGKGTTQSGQCNSPRIAEATGAISTRSDDAKSIVKCPTGFVGQACKCDLRCDGSYFSNQETCIASNRRNVGGVKAKVTCIEKACVKTRINPLSVGYVPGPTVTCPADYELVSCSIYSPWSQSYASFMTTEVTGNTCVGPSQCRKCRVQAVCIAKKKCRKDEEKWDTKSSKCILRCPNKDTKWHIESISCMPRCLDIQTKWDGKICALRCPNQDEQWSSVKSACILRCPDVNTKWDQTQGKCVDRCAGHMQWDNQQKKCTSRCAAADKWDEAKKTCTPRCPSHQNWMTDKCENKCPTGEKWHDPTNKCFQDVMYPKTEEGNGQGAACVIPFLYGSKWQEDCVQGNEKMWCSTTENYDADKKWGYCPVMCRTKGGLTKFPGDAWTDGGKGVFCDTDGTIGMIIREFSFTTGGDGGGAGCAFPYLYNGRYHGKCVISTTLPWCGTVKDGSKWGYCPSQCMPKDGSRKNAGEWWMEGQMKYFCDENVVIQEIKDLLIKTKDGVQCVFPFKYNSRFYGGCTGTTPWCATTADYDADAKWGHCAVTCLTQDKMKVNAGATWSYGGKEYACGRDGKVRANVNTTSGNCLFPFSYNGNMYETCTEAGSAGKPWCYIDEAENAYGYC
ncbi:balbiani ring protein 3-like [Lineus longissimus]|uniref:balbiani ring protein 3-like n=1 Tax=Lineus longissimus TaxID=88925 RepID=UPI00315DAFAB